MDPIYYLKKIGYIRETHDGKLSLNGSWISYKINDLYIDGSHKLQMEEDDLEIAKFVLKQLKDLEEDFDESDFKSKEDKEDR